MKIVIIYNHKGGVAKTTTTINTATFLSAYYDKKICIIDCDDYQWTTYEKYQGEKEKVLKSYNNDPEKILKAIEEKEIVDNDVEKCLMEDFDDKLLEIQNKNYDYVFVDLGNRTLKEAKAAFSKADQIVVPYSNDQDEINEALKFYEAIEEVFPLVPIYCLVLKIEANRVSKHNKIKEILSASNNIKYYDSIILKRQRYIETKSFFYPLDYQTEYDDVKYGLISFTKELLEKTA
ncbi:ParA family protein (plasmid) [Aquimarina sp. TRL1]|uniref:ParA family protein n=1 Tax=Aquimarina sp. (strain TRL1) TaxID=2736252 RepID=UPI00158C3EFC|nr:ParA family protein [Aquimarina sp. TRL1]QKX07734.1 ParA family protein [Aquimarina sp. TRL1]